MAKALAYWHTHALGFKPTAIRDAEAGSNVLKKAEELERMRLAKA